MYSERVMIWLLTRVTISSTTCPVARAGRHAKATRTRQSFFIRFQWAGAFWACGQKAVCRPMSHFNPLERILLERAGPVSLTLGVGAELAGYPTRTRARAVRSSHKGDPALNSV